MRRDDRSRLGEPALDLLEAAVHLVRTAPAATHAAHAAGNLPFALGLLWFWADMSRGADADRRLAGAALGMALLFAWQKAWQAVYAGRLRAQLAGAPPPRWSTGRVLRMLAVQAPLQATGLVLIPLTSLPLLMLPTPWVFAFYQGLAATADEAGGGLVRAVRIAGRQAARWPGQNHGLIALLIPLALTVWLNLGIALATLPWLLRTLLGIETDFVVSLAAVFNTTFLAAVTVLAAVVLDPFVKAAYVIRCFQADSLVTGDDLRAGLRRHRAAQAAAAALGLALLFGPADGPTLRAQGMDPAAAPSPSPASAPPGTARDLDAAIGRVLERPEYRWRAPRVVGRETGKPLGWQERLSERIRASLEWAGRTVGEGFQSVARWIRRILNTPGTPKLPRGAQQADWTSGVTQAGYAALTLVILAAGIHALRRWLRNRRPPPAASASPAAPPVPDLAAADVQASELPEDEWLRMAARLGAEGDWRLALRAVHLAVLAHLAGREWVRLARHKTNRDYARELARRSRQVPGVTDRFAAASLAFERTWYGDHPAGPEQVEEIRDHLRHLRQPGGPA